MAASSDRGAAVDNAYEGLVGLPQVCRDTRQLKAPVHTRIGGAVGETALLYHGRTGGELVPGNGSVRPVHGLEVMDG